MKKEYLLIGMIALGTFLLVSRNAAAKAPKLTAANVPLYSSAQPGTIAWNEWLQASGYVQ